jgi:hypothetical protein
LEVLVSLDCTQVIQPRQWRVTGNPNFRRDSQAFLISSYKKPSRTEPFPGSLKNEVLCLVPLIVDPSMLWELHDGKSNGKRRFSRHGNCEVAT